VIALGLALALPPATAHARGLELEVWTNRGNDAVYQPGELMQVKVRSTEDAYALVYEIDAEGYVHLLFPEQGMRGLLEGRRTYRLPPEDSNVELVVKQPVGQCYIVAIASAEPFEALPWYLRPYNPQAEDVGYVGAPEDEEGVTAEGRLVGDPFVAMERIRRRVLRDAKDARDGETFSTAYTSYYVHQEVRYPRYVCYDCHRPGRWAWWDGFDPYYSTCSVFDLRVNWSWYWGPRYWYGSVPYFVYIYRPDCPPHYRRHYGHTGWYSSWDGWTRWCDLWGLPNLTRYKSPPPPGYVPPSKFKAASGSPGMPPGFLSDNVRRGRGLSPALPVGRGGEVRGEGGAGTREQRPVPGARTPRDESPRPSPVTEPREERAPWTPPAREARPAPATRPPRDEAPAPRRDDAPPPRSVERPSYQAPRQDPPRPPNREERPAPPPKERAAPAPPKGNGSVEKPRQERGQTQAPRDSGAPRGRRWSG
jgi:hypothetical protein